MLSVRRNRLGPPMLRLMPSIQLIFPKLPCDFVPSTVYRPTGGKAASKMMYISTGSSIGNIWRSSRVKFAGRFCRKEYVIIELLNTILPHGTAAVEAFTALPATDLFPEESDLVRNVNQKRRTEFSLGRSCAHQALAKLGTEPQPILRGASREPIWPGGIVGSITHCDGYCAAAVARKTNVSSFGIDAEPIRPVSDDVFRLIATKPEAAWIGRKEPSARSLIPWELLVFSAKESVFKTWFPIVGTWLGFDQVRIEFDEISNEFRAVISGLPVQAPKEFSRLHGRFIVGATHVLTCAYINVN